MKTLILFRHGKSDWNTDYAADHDRPLAKRGRNAAATMGAMLARIEQVSDRVLTSSAVRARETVELAAEAGGWKCLDLDSWSRVEADKGTLVWFLIPRLVKAMGLRAE